VLRADYAVIPKSVQTQGFSLEVANRLRSETAFSTVEEFRMGVFGVSGSAQQMIATDPTTLDRVENVKMQTGSLSDLRDGDVLIYKTVAEDHHWRVGQTITAQFARTGKQPLRIVGIFGDNRGLANYVVTLGTFEGNFTQQLDASILLKTAPGVTAAQARAAAGRVTTAFPNVKVENQEELRKTTAAQINQLLGLITALLALSIMIAFFGVANTLGLSILERTRELGLLRAVGMARRQVRSMVRWESVIISVFGAILGMAVGVFFGWATVQALKSQGINVLSLPAGQLILYLVIAAIFGVLAAIGPAKRAAKLNILQAIATE
jgi:putative ABC transport system permease protein